MLNTYVANILTNYLGQYIANLNRETLKVSVWHGKVKLTQMQLRPTALDKLQLPFFVARGVIRDLEISIPWTKLQTESCVISIRGVRIVLAPKRQQPWDQEQEEAAADAEKQRLLDAWEMERTRRSAGGDDGAAEEAGSQGFTARLASTLIGNIQVQVSDVCVRYEDAAVADDLFSVSFLFHELLCRTTDAEWRPTFVVDQRSGEDKHKAVELKGFSLSVDAADAEGVAGRQLPDDEWGELVCKLSAESARVVDPVDCHVRIRYQASHRKMSSRRPHSQLDVIVDALHAAVLRVQYLRLRRLADYVSGYSRVAWLRRLRPTLTVKQAPRSWWRFCIEAVRRIKRRGRFSWAEYELWKVQRDRYVQLHQRKQDVAFLEPLTAEEEKEHRSLERMHSFEHLRDFRQRAYTKLRLGREEWERRSALRQQLPAAAPASGGGGAWSWFGYYFSGGQASPDDSAEVRADIEEVKSVINGTAAVPRHLLEEVGWGSDDDDPESPHSATRPDDNGQPPVSLCLRLLAKRGSLKLRQEAGDEDLVGAADFRGLECTQTNFHNVDAFTSCIELESLQVAGHRSAALPFQLRRAVIGDDYSASDPLVAATMERRPPAAAVGSPRGMPPRGSYHTDVKLAPVVAVVDASWVDALHGFFRGPAEVGAAQETEGADALRGLNRRGAAHALALLLEREAASVHMRLHRPTVLIPSGEAGDGTCLLMSSGSVRAATRVCDSRLQRLPDPTDDDFYDGWDVEAEGVSAAVATIARLGDDLMKERVLDARTLPDCTRLLASFPARVSVERSLVPRLAELPWVRTSVRCAEPLQLCVTRRLTQLCVASVSRLSDALAAALWPADAAAAPDQTNPLQVKSQLRLEFDCLAVVLREHGVAGVPADDSAAPADEAERAGRGAKSGTLVLSGAVVEMLSRHLDLQLAVRASAISIADDAAAETEPHRDIARTSAVGGVPALRLMFQTLWDGSPLEDGHRGSNRTQLALDGVRLVVCSALARVLECLWDLSALLVFTHENYYAPPDRVPVMVHDPKQGRERERPCTEFLLALSECELLFAEAAESGAEADFIRMSLPAVPRTDAELCALQEALSRCRVPSEPPDGASQMDMNPSIADDANTIEWRMYASASVLSGRLLRTAMDDLSTPDTRFSRIVGAELAGDAAQRYPGGIHFAYLMMNEAAANAGAPNHRFTHFLRCSVIGLAAVYWQTLFLHVFTHFTTGTVARLCSVASRPFFDGGDCWVEDAAERRPAKRLKPGAPDPLETQYLSIGVDAVDCYLVLPPLLTSTRLFAGRLGGLHISNVLREVGPAATVLELAYRFEGVTLRSPGSDVDAIADGGLELKTEWAVKDVEGQLCATRNTLSTPSLGAAFGRPEYHTFLEVLGRNLMHGYPRHEGAAPPPPVCAPPVRSTYQWVLDFGDVQLRLAEGGSCATVQFEGLLYSMDWQSDGATRTRFSASGALLRWVGLSDSDVIRCTGGDGAAAVSVEYDCCNHAEGPEDLRPLKSVPADCSLSVTRFAASMQRVHLLLRPKGLFWCRDFLLSKAALASASGLYAPADVDRWQLVGSFSVADALVLMPSDAGVFGCATLSDISVSTSRGVDGDARVAAAVCGLVVRDERTQTDVLQTDPKEKVVAFEYAAPPGEEAGRLPRASLVVRPVRLVLLSRFSHSLSRFCVAPETLALAWLGTAAEDRPAAVSAALGDAPVAVAEEREAAAAADTAQQLEYTIEIANPSLLVPTRSDGWAEDSDNIEFDFGCTTVQHTVDRETRQSTLRLELSRLKLVGSVDAAADSKLESPFVSPAPHAAPFPASPPRSRSRSGGSSDLPASRLSPVLRSDGRPPTRLERAEILQPVNIDAQATMNADGKGSVTSTVHVSPVSLRLPSRYYQLILRAVAENLSGAPDEDAVPLESPRSPPSPAVPAASAAPASASAMAVRVSVPKICVELPSVLDFQITSLSASYTRRTMRTITELSLETIETTDARPTSRLPSHFRRLFKHGDQLIVVVTAETRPCGTQQRSAQVNLGRPSLMIVPDALYALHAYAVPPFRKILGRGEHWVRRVEVSDDVRMDHDVELSADKEVWHISATRFNRIKIDLGDHELRMTSGYFSTRPLITVDPSVTVEIRAARIVLPQGKTLEQLCDIGDGSNVLQLTPGGSPQPQRELTRMPTMMHGGMSARSFVRSGSELPTSELIVTVEGWLEVVIADLETASDDTLASPSASEQPKGSPSGTPLHMPLPHPDASSDASNHVRVIVASCGVNVSLTQQRLQESGQLVLEKGRCVLRSLSAQTELRSSEQPADVPDTGEVHYIVAPCEISATTRLAPASRTGSEPRMKVVEVRLCTPLRARVSFLTVSMVHDLVRRGLKVAYGGQSRQTVDDAADTGPIRESDVQAGPGDDDQRMANHFNLYASDAEVVLVDDRGATDMPLFKTSIRSLDSRLELGTRPGQSCCTLVLIVDVQSFRQEYCLWEAVLTNEQLEPVELLCELRLGESTQANCHSQKLLLHCSPALIHKINHTVALWSNIGRRVGRSRRGGLKGHQRYRVENATGDPVEVLEQRADGVRVHLLAPGRTEPLPVVSLDCADSVDAAQGHSVKVRFPQLDQREQRVSLSSVGRRIIRLGDVPVVVDTHIEKQRGCKVTRLRSNLTIKNSTSVPLGVGGVHGTVAPLGGLASIPLTDTCRGHLFLVPAGEHSWITWRLQVPYSEIIASVERGEQPGPYLVKCPRHHHDQGVASPARAELSPTSAVSSPPRVGCASPTGAECSDDEGFEYVASLEDGLPFYCYAVVTAKRLHGSGLTVSGVDCVMELLPPFSIENLLKLPLTVRCYQEIPSGEVRRHRRLVRRVKRAARSVRFTVQKMGGEGAAALQPADSDTVMLPVDAGVVQPYHTLQLLSYDPHYPLSASFEFVQPTGQCVAGGDRRLYHRLHRDRDKRPDFVVLEDDRGCVFHANLKFVEHAKCGVGLGVQLFAQYWINNQTNLSVGVSLGSRARGLAGLIPEEGIPPNAGAPFVAAPAKDDPEKGRLRIGSSAGGKSVWSEWSDEFETKLGANGVVECKLDAKAQRQAGGREPRYRTLSYFVATPEGWGQSKVLCFTWRWLLINRAPFGVWLRHDIASSGTHAVSFGPASRTAGLSHQASQSIGLLHLGTGQSSPHCMGRTKGNFLALALAQSATEAPEQGLFCPMVSIDADAAERRNLQRPDGSFEAVRISVYIRGGVAHFTVDHDPAPPVMIENRTNVEVLAWQQGRREDRHVVRVAARASRPMWWTAPDGPYVVVVDVGGAEAALQLTGPKPGVQRIAALAKPPELAEQAAGRKHGKGRKSPPLSRRPAEPTTSAGRRAAPTGAPAEYYAALRAGRAQGGSRTVHICIAPEAGIDGAASACADRSLKMTCRAMAVSLCNDAAVAGQGGQVCVLWVEDFDAKVSELANRQERRLELSFGAVQVDDQREAAPDEDAKAVAVAPTFADGSFSFELVCRRDVLGMYSSVPKFLLQIQPLSLCVEDFLIFELLQWLERARSQTKREQKLSDLSAAEVEAILVQESQASRLSADSAVNRTVSVGELVIEAVAVSVTLRRRRDGQDDPLKGVVGRARHFIRNVDDARLVWDTCEMSNVQGTLWLLCSRVIKRYYVNLKAQWYKLVVTGGMPRPLEWIKAPKDERQRYARTRLIPRGVPTDDDAPASAEQPIELRRRKDSFFPRVFRAGAQD
eukprot:TRINITY_DN23288_c0_g1_i1.p1 TRINITY_DN23288_c0_g1~~TRINITY_DN23288_c0_g1_i1.p1  ORF type:complete len:3698 (+),score=1378.04 TRINITY_DN23288_c0_g1_i1:98-11191(+)